MLKRKNTTAQRVLDVTRLGSPCTVTWNFNAVERTSLIVPIAPSKLSSSKISVDISQGNTVKGVKLLQNLKSWKRKNSTVRFALEVTAIGGRFIITRSSNVGKRPGFSVPSALTRRKSNKTSTDTSNSVIMKYEISPFNPLNSQRLKCRFRRRKFTSVKSVRKSTRTWARSIAIRSSNVERGPSICVRSALTWRNESQISRDILQNSIRNIEPFSGLCDH